MAKFVFKSNPGGHFMAGNIADYLASYASSITYEDIPPEVVRQVKVLLIDTLGCGLGGYASEPARIARRMAERVSPRYLPATVLGTGLKSSPELATFANGTMIRYLDLNDAYFSKEGGHPSDCFAPILTCADAVHKGGKEVIVASVLAYEVFCRLSDRFSISPKGFDHAITGLISAVMGVSKILGLSREEMVQAINLAVVSNIALGQTRVGEVSLWKGCALANAGRNAVFAVMLAKEGMTGPSPIFEGRKGFFEAVSGPFQLEEFGGHGRSFRMMDVMIKRYPCGTFSQTAIDAALKVRSQISSVDDIATVSVGTFHFGKTAMAGDAEKWHPKTRESADHSIPYVVGISLMYAPPEIKHFSEEYLHDPALLNLMQKIQVEETEECRNLYPGATANRVEITTKSGQKFSELVKYHRGHHRNPLTNDEIEQKFYSLSRDLLPIARSQDLLALIWNLEQVGDIATLMERFIF
jgi:2-methylcitrate dehydratase